MRRVRLAVALVLLALMSVSALNSSAAFALDERQSQGSIGVRLVDVPADAGNDPRARLYVVDDLAPGTVIHRRIQISNTSHTSALVALYSAAATIARGTFLGAPARTPNDLSSWTSLTPSAASIAPGSQLTATVTIAVPHDAAPGERYAVVWAETRSAGTASGLTEVNRVGIRLYVSVGPGGPPATNFSIESLTAKRSAQGQALVVASVHNTGGRALDLSGSLALSGGPAGLSAGPFPATLGVTLAVGDTEPITIALDKRLPAGPWQALVTLRSGLVERTGRATITFPDSGSSAAVATSSTRSRWLILTGVGLLVLLGSAVLAVGARQRRSRRNWSVTRYA
jgi:hypothetical protein